jgi:hypothetical protein
MESIMAFVRPAYEFVHAGFADVKSQVMALVIALLAAILMTKWGRLLFVALGAAVIHTVIGAVLPMAQGGALAVPDVMAGSFWGMFLGLYVGYLILIAIFFFLKHNVFRMGGGGGGH